MTTYKVNIIKDYKNGVTKFRVYQHHSSLRSLLFAFSLILVLACFMWNLSDEQAAGSPLSTLSITEVPTASSTGIIESPSDATRYVVAEAASTNRYIVDNQETFSTKQYTINNQSEIATVAGLSLSFADIAFTDIEHIEEQLFDISSAPVKQYESVPLWQRVTVKAGDSLALIFSRLGLSPNALYNIMSLGQEVSQLKQLRPGQILNFHIVEKELFSLEYEMAPTKSLKINKQYDRFSAKLVTAELESVVRHVHASIKDSLFLSGKRAGLSDRLMMQMVSIYGWDIDFALDVHENDTFTIIYEEQYKDGVKVSEGPIIAAEFTNRNKSLRAVRYTHQDGRVDYYSDDGDAMRKAFLRTPLEFTRISSHFKLKRKHPILNSIRAHKGIDYAAPIGTPIKATGNGIVTLAQRQNGYGKTVILKHGEKHSTVYAHIHRYAKGIRVGKRVKQGQIIGYVGKSGLATAPHLHYEFRLNGLHRNPLTVKLPKAESISQVALPEFRKAIMPLLSELDRLTNKRVLASQQPAALPIKQL